MPGDRNIYKTARRSAGLTQEAAAERLDISVESIRAYETGQRIPPNDVVARMAVHYNNLMLGYDHCRETDDLMASIIPKLDERTLLESAVRMYNCMNRFDRKHRIERLMEIAEDNYVDEDERAEYEETMSEVMEFIKISMELVMFRT